MIENTSFGKARAQEKAKIFDGLFKADYLANVYYPQMFGPKQVGLGAAFLQSFLDKQMTFSEFEMYYIGKRRNKVKEIQGDVNRIHAHYGRTAPVAAKDIKRVFTSVQDGTRWSLASLFGTPYVRDYFDASEHLPHIESALSLINAGVTSLYTPEMKNHCDEYRNSFAIFFEKGRDGMSRSEKDEARTKWRSFSQIVENTLTESITSQNRALGMPFEHGRVRGYLERVAKEGSRVVTQI